MIRQAPDLSALSRYNYCKSDEYKMTDYYFYGISTKNKENSKI